MQSTQCSFRRRGLKWQARTPFTLLLSIVAMSNHYRTVPTRLKNGHTRYSLGFHLTTSCLSKLNTTKRGRNANLFFQSTRYARPCFECATNNSIMIGTCRRRDIPFQCLDPRAVGLLIMPILIPYGGQVRQPPGAVLSSYAIPLLETRSEPTR